MTYLELCQMAGRYQGGGNELPGTGPTTVVGQTGYNYELVLAVSDAYKSIQNEQDYWRFMQKQGSFALVSGTRVVTQAELVVQVSDYYALRPNTVGAGYRFCQLYADSSGVGSEAPCIYIPYSEWRGTIDQNTMPTGRPNLFTIRPDRAVEFNLLADQDYHFVCDYKRTVDAWVQTASVSVPDPDAQTPIFPDRFHEIVAWRAVWLWAASVEDAGKLQFAVNEYKRIRAEMCFEQLPENLPFVNAFDTFAGVGGGY